jgi:cellulose synthase/poly-beta-1,6-N-acetylglucosamine synthase-like glycosyltransferase
VVHNEERYIGSKIENILSLDYPIGKIEIIIGSDGSTDTTNEKLKQYEQKGVKVFISQQHEGKVGILNQIVPTAKGEILVFSDARQIFEKNALKELVANFAYPSIGCVSGELILRNFNNSTVSDGIGLYWDYEKFIRKKESEIYSMLGATGAIYAVRRKLFIAPSNNTILDDMFIPLKVVEQGYRAVFDSKAIAYDNIACSSKEEFKRKVRTLAGNFQLFLQFGNLLNPFKSKIAWQLFSHKFLRAFAWIFLILIFFTNLFLLEDYGYRVILIGQIIFYLIALICWDLEKKSIKIKYLNFSYVFCLLNIAAFVGFYFFITGKQKVTWK